MRLQSRELALVASTTASSSLIRAAYIKAVNRVARYTSILMAI